MIMAQNISDQYEMVNSLMRMVGEDEFEFEIIQMKFGNFNRSLIDM